ncbi:MAG: ABC transporter ATP-binding protein [Hyphomicrobiaceae bacterium]|nr:MAG: ABC transporter ATP-binding protein [Hyphomicrobiaceae bacterium]
MTSLILDNVCVDFPIYGSQRSLRRVLFERATGAFVQREKDRVTVKALRNISFTLNEGDRLALVGHNGAGKSTLLRTIAGVYQPVEGRILVGGTITPLFDVLPGIDPEDTAYENIRTAGMLFGLSREKIEQIMPDIEEFSELGEYMGLPVRTYSTGMTMRLGFAFATAMDPGILLLDEGVGAGDARFADRAAKRMEDFIGRSRIVVFASHSNALVEKMCNKAALMQGGRMLAIGEVQDILERYEVLIRGGGGVGASIDGAAAPA